MNGSKSSKIDPSIYSFVDEWSTRSEISHATLKPTPFEEDLYDVLNSYQILQSAVSRRDPRASEIAHKVLGEALEKMASVESKLERMLALEDDNALLVLESLQMYLDHTPEHHPWRSAALHLLIKLAHRSTQFPSSLIIDNVTIPSALSCKYGGFGDVYEGLLDGKPVAVKKPRVIMTDLFAYKRLYREALVWRQLQHLNVLPFIGLNTTLFPANDLPALLSPWMEYGSLKEYVCHAEYQAERDIPNVINGIARGTAYLHSLDITHGDIKHLNILIDQERNPRLADFGMVWLGASMAAGGFTQTTNGYDLRWSSPQRLDGETRSLPDDVYSFGCVCYYLYSGCMPFEGISDAKAGMWILRGKRPTRPGKCIIELDDQMWNIVNHCWSQDWEARPTMAAVCNKLCISGASDDVRHVDHSMWPDVEAWSEPTTPTASGAVLPDLPVQSLPETLPGTAPKGKMEHQFQQLSDLRITRCAHCGDKMWGAQYHCDGCDIAIHLRCLYVVHKSCWRPLDKEVSDMFGRELFEQSQLDDRGDGVQVPLIVQKCIQAIEVHGMNYGGIYKRPGSETQCAKIIQLFHRSDYAALDLCDYNQFDDICAVTSVLKNYLRALPNPLLTFDLQGRFLAAVCSQDSYETMDAMRTLVRWLPSEYYFTLKALMLHLHRVAERRNVNLMGPQELGKVFGPALFWARSPSTTDDDAADRAHCVERLIAGAPQIFNRRSEFDVEASVRRHVLTTFH